jgi:type IV secretory pathway VirB4 component
VTSFRREEASRCLADTGRSACIQGRDFTCMAESVNAVEAWLGSLPGHAYANVRQPPVSTLNLAHMIPLSTV